MEQKKSSIPRIIMFMISVLMLGFVAIYCALNSTTVLDRLTAFLYDAPSEIITIEDKLALTDKAKVIFRASKPALESRDEFNLHCDSHDRTVSVLGCYTTNQIFLYNVESAELNGVVESTAAHELLHAVWERLSPAEIAKLTPLIKQAYDENQELLSEDLKTYDDAEQLEELHSRIGTEITKLPSELEAHYAKYFQNQDNIVAYYDQYIEPFRALSREMETIESELTSIAELIEQLEADYHSSADNLNFEIEDFNNCARQSGCFASDAVFQNRRNELIAKQSILDDQYQNLNSVIRDYNTKVNKYNDNILRNNTLEEAINSNAKSESLIKKE